MELMKSDKELSVHILKSLPKAYGPLKTVLQMKEDYLDKLKDIKSAITQHWKINFRGLKKKKKNKKRRKTKKNKWHIILILK